MSLYNMLFGVNSAAPLLLAMLGIDKNAVPRFRDCFLADGKIVIHTRTGGGNREAYEAENDALTTLPGYVSDSDDDFDCTYANFIFEVPVKFAHLLGKIPEGVDPAKRWQETFEKLRTASPDDPQVKKITEVMAPVLDQIKASLDGDGPKIIEI